MTRTERTLNIDPQTGTVHSYTYGAAYDSWGRVREMIYPDGEKVTYGYHPTGELKSITGENGANKDVYLKETGYTVYGETAYRQLGNGTESIYMFDENERLLTSTLNMNGNSVSVNTYTYDKADNITDIYQSSGRYMQHYEYDDMNRLIKANGIDNSTIGDTPYSHYSMSMSYNVMSSPLKVEKNINSEFSNLIYQYGTENHPNVPKQVGDTKYTYSASGNPLTITGAGVDRSLTWDAENRLRMIEDNESGTLHLYTYNHAGERALKRFGTAQTMAVNGRTVATLLDVNENYSAYVSPYFVESNNRYTKHYYAGTMRLASKIGGAVYKGVDGEQAGGDNPKQEPSESADEPPAELNPGDTYKAGTDEPDLYFYFTDHLGSTTYITDREEVAQYVAYTPYGETFKEYRNVTPYKFNGKERDDETGYYYYGARYYDPGTALWFGTDPLAHKYPMNSPYVYCNANPVKYVDPDGNVVLVAKLSASAGVGMSYGLSGRMEAGIAVDNYGVTIFGTVTGNAIYNQNLQSGSRNPRIFAGLYAGVGAGVEINWQYDSYSDYLSSCSTSIPIGPVSASVGYKSAGVTLGVGLGLAFDTSPSSYNYSVSMSKSEAGAALGILSTDSGIMKMDFDPKRDAITDDNDVIIGYNATINFTDGDRTVSFNVRCQADADQNPNGQWETIAYRNLKNQDN